MEAKIHVRKKVEIAKVNVSMEPSIETLDYYKNNAKSMVK
jgi:hypothetical protein